jgi:hypothetical protein
MNVFGDLDIIFLYRNRAVIFILACKLRLSLAKNGENIFWYVPNFVGQLCLQALLTLLHCE